jgi:phospholipid transport system substrate-binding protein
MTLKQIITPAFKPTIAISLAIMFIFGFATQAAAQQVEKAQDDPDGALIFVEKLSNDAIEALDDMSLTQDERDHTFRELLRDGFDLDYIGKLSLGRHWRTANTEQRKEYERVFPEYVLSIYSNRLRERGDETFEVINSVPAGKRDLYVRSEIIRKDGPPIAADWRVRYKNEEFRIVDLKIEGISMVITQREGFASRINKVGLNELLEEIRVKSKVDEVSIEAENTDIDASIDGQAP